MGIYKRGKGWEVAVATGERYENGRPVYRREMVDTEQEAEKKEYELLLEIQRLRTELKQAYPKEQKCLTRFKTIADKWLKKKVFELAPRTYERYENIFNKYLIPTFGNKAISKITEDEIRNYLTSHSNSNTTMQQHYTLLKGIFGEVKIKVMDEIKRPRKEHTEIYCIKDPEELVEFIKSLKDTMLFIPAYIAAVTGMRLSEIAGLKWEDVNLKTGYITVNRSLHWGKDEKTKLRKWYTKATKRNSSKRTIKISQKDVEILQAHKEITKAGKSDFVCLDTNGNPLAKDSVSSNFKARAKVRGWDISFHSLRHSHATILLQHYRMTTSAVSKRLGHSKETTTLTIYTSAIPREDDEIAETIGRMMQAV